MKKHWPALAHHVWKIIKANHLAERKIIVCVSGGSDSMALINILLKVQKPELLSLFHFHHGPGKNEKFRNQAFDFVAALAKEKMIPFLAERSKVELKNETECRKARRESLAKFCKKSDVIATGHHNLDLLETRLIRLLRGTGAQGLKAMSEWKSPWFRPFLNCQPQDLKDYLRSEGESWLEDPSNGDIDILRNWLRRQWLPQVEQIRPGSCSTLARSLQNLAESLDASSLKVPQGKQLRRSYYLTCSQYEQRELLSRWFFAQGVRNFSRAQIEELQRQLDKSQNELILKIGPLMVNVNAQQILLIKS